MLKILSQAASVFVVLIGACALAGWALDLPGLKSILPGLATMKANTALAFLLGGGALWLLREERERGAQRALALAGIVLMLALGGLTLAEYAGRWNFGIDQLLFRDLAKSMHPGRMAPATAVNVVLCGLALGCLWARWTVLAQCCAAVMGLLSLFALVGYAYEVRELYRFRAYSSMALNTAAAFHALAVGVLCARPAQGLMAPISSERAGGRMARSLLVAALLVPLGIGWLCVAGQHAGWFGGALGTALFALSSVIIFTALIWLNACSLNAAHEKILHRERLYAVLSECNQSIVKIGEREPLFARVCEIAVDLGKFRMAWIGLADRETHMVNPVAAAGVEPGFLESAGVSQRDELSGCPPAGAAIREKRPVICNDIQRDSRMAPLREEALKRGFRSAAAFPLRNNGDVLGSFVLYAGEVNFFNEDEVKLLEEVTGDISYALKQMEHAAQRRKAEAETARLGAELQMILDTVPAMIFYKDRAHRLVRANAAALRAFGRPWEELLGKTDAELGLPHAAQYARDEDEIAATGQPKLNYIEPFEGPDGVRWFQTDKVPLRDAAGKVTGFIGLALDITERQRAEEALREREADFRASFLSTAVGQVQADSATGRYLRVNPKFCEITGYTEEELLRMTFRELTHPDDRESDSAAHQNMVEGKMAELTREKRYRRKDGSTVWVSISASIIRDAQGRPLRTLAVVRDITARRAAEEARSAAEAKYRGLVEQSLVGIYIIQDDRFVYVNPMIADLLGCSPEEILARTVMDFIHEEDRPMVTENLRKRLHGEVESVRYNLRMRRKDRSVVHVEVHGARAEYEGRPAILGTLLDMSERRRIEEQFLQSQKMEAIGQLAGGIAHDFNNLLMAIGGNTRLATEDLPGDHPAQRYLAEIGKARARAADLVRRILTFSRQQSHERKVIQLRAVVEEALRLLRASLPAMIEIRTHYAADPPLINADATQIHQIIMNLGTNASHAMQGSGVLEIRESVIDVDADLARTSPDLREGRYLHLALSDSGSGIDRATLARIFEPFFTTKPQGEGTGLGLSVVHGIMKSHGGAVTGDSEPGQGTVFHLYFPVTAGDLAEKAAPVAAPAHPGAGEHILYVDDEEQLVFLATHILERLGYRVTGFIEAAEALAAFQAAPDEYDVVITDMSMPRMTGPQLAGHLLKIRPDLLIVLTTGYVRPDDIENARQMGIRDLILKPNTIEEMGQSVHRLLVERSKEKQAPAGG